MNEGRERLFRRFDELGIEAPTVPYPSHRTVDEGKALRGDMCGTFTKNLLLKDKKGAAFSRRRPRRPNGGPQVVAHPNRCLAQSPFRLGR